MSLKAKVESAFKQLLQAAHTLPAGVNVYTGADVETQRRPCVVCQAKGGEGAELVAAGDNRFYNVTVLVKSEAELKDKTLNPLDEHNDNAAAIWGILQVDDLAEQLSALVSDFTVFSPVTDEGEDPDIQGRALVDSLMFKVYCCGSDIS